MSAAHKVEAPIREDLGRQHAAWPDEQLKDVGSETDRRLSGLEKRVECRRTADEDGPDEINSEGLAGSLSVVERYSDTSYFGIRRVKVNDRSLGSDSERPIGFRHLTLLRTVDESGDPLPSRMREIWVSCAPFSRNSS